MDASTAEHTGDRTKKKKSRGHTGCAVGEKVFLNCYALALC
jgi:hypothetical protein